MQILSIL